MKVKSIAECSLGAFCNTFDLHKAIIIFFLLVLDCTCPRTSKIKLKFFTCPVLYNIEPDGTSKAVSKVDRSVTVDPQDSA